jgi:hypothetical protein
MTGLPLAFVGAFGLLLLFGNTVNMFSLMGLIPLVGIATKNGILLVDFTNRIRARGFRVDAALVEAGTTSCALCSKPGGTSAWCTGSATSTAVSRLAQGGQYRGARVGTRAPGCGNAR